MDEEIDNFKTFIEFIIDLASDEFGNYVPCSMRLYFRNGGCLELAKILQYFIPSIHIYFSMEEDHFIVFYNGKFYDAFGEKENTETFQEVSYEYLQQHGEKYGKDILFEGKPVHLAMIQELKACSGNYVSELVTMLNDNAQNKIEKLNLNKTYLSNHSNCLTRKLGMPFPNKK